MNDSKPFAPAPPVMKMQKLMRTELSSPARLAYTLLLLADLAMGAIVLSLWLTEPELPMRTHVAFALMVLVSAGWAAFFVWTLTRRTLFLARHRLVSARLAVGFTALFAGGALLLGVLDAEVRSVAFSAAALGGVMLAVAIAILLFARRRVRELLDRRVQLGGGGGASLDS